MAQLVDPIVALVKSIIRKELGAWSPYVQGTFVSSETVDSNLSIVKVAGNQCRYVRKLAQVPTLTAGQSVLLIQGGGIPMTIIGVPVGDLRKANNGNN